MRIVNIDETITTMYPLVEPALEDISEQLSNDVPIDQLALNEHSRYTQTLLIEAIKAILEKPRFHPDHTYIAPSQSSVLYATSSNSPVFCYRTLLFL